MSTDVQPAPKVEGLQGPGKRKHRDSISRRHLNISAPFGNKKHKSDDSKHFKFSKKRSQGPGGGKIYPPFKKRNKKDKLIPPTKFLLGGNIRDPLNLNSLQDEEVNRAVNAVTPESSPLPTPQHRKGPVEVIIPADIRDPLSLAGGEEDDEAYAASFLHQSGGVVTPRKGKKKNRKRRSKGASGGESAEVGVKAGLESSKSDETEENQDKSEPIPSTSSDLKEKDEPAPKTEVEKDLKDTPSKEKREGGTGGGGEATGAGGGAGREFKKPKLSFEKFARKSSTDMKDRIVSPVIPQPGAWPNTGRFRKQGLRKSNQPTPNFKESGKRFQYGNYNRYYGYRNPTNEDPRLKVFQQHSQLFAGKDVLDIGCNTGTVSTSVARDLGARSVVGLDIDKGLVESARQRLRRSSKEFPPSMPLVYGPLDVPGVQEANTFPHNLTFIQGNYVLDNDILVDLEQAQFDVILCLSVTKWFHLNWGDPGLKRAFRRMYSQLRPGGLLILEPQDWSSYKRKKNLTEITWKNYQSIKMYPSMFTEYLLTEVGFGKCEVISTPMHPHKGFQRPIKMFTKGETPLSSRTPHSQGSGSLAATPRHEPAAQGPARVPSPGGDSSARTPCAEDVLPIPMEEGSPEGVSSTTGIPVALQDCLTGPSICGVPGDTSEGVTSTYADGGSPAQIEALLPPATARPTSEGSRGSPLRSSGAPDVPMEESPEGVTSSLDGASRPPPAAADSPSDAPSEDSPGGAPDNSHSEEDSEVVTSSALSDRGAGSSPFQHVIADSDFNP